MWYIWLIAAGVFFVAEIATVGFLIFWLGIAALLSMVVSFFTSNVFIQMLIFVISSCILIPLTKPLNNLLNKSDEDIKTNAFSIIDKYGVVTSKIMPNYCGQVKVDGQTWSATTEDNATQIDVNTSVRILKIEGVKLIVEPISSSINQ